MTRLSSELNPQHRTDLKRMGEFVWLLQFKEFFVKIVAEHKLKKLQRLHMTENSDFSKYIRKVN